MTLRTFLSRIRNILNEIRLVSDRWFEEEQQTEPFAPISDFDEQDIWETVSCTPRPCPELRELWERTLKIGTDNDQ